MKTYQQLLDEYSIPYLTEGAQCTNGWVGMRCPFCDDDSEHLGMNLKTGAFNCWRCGGKSTTEAFRQLLGISRGEVRRLLKECRGSRAGSKPSRTSAIRVKRSPQLPYPNWSLMSVHKRYLRSRGYDPEELESTWNLLGTGGVSFLDGIDFKYRILVPIYWRGKRASFQARDITGKASLRYLSCPQQRETTPYKRTLYGKEKAWGDTGICVEGITDVWRFGPEYAFATFGITYTHSQMRTIANRFKRVFIIFDNEPQAILQAQKLKGDLVFRRVDAHCIPIEEAADPADMTQQEADRFVKKLTRRWH